jgi:hypothetical protein
MSQGERHHSGSKAYVFVVCGSREHLDTLSYSLEALRHMTQCRIIVVTDSRRNEVTISWPNILDVATPTHFTHHQASIYLKTSLHRILPKGPCYCYLDTDVIAISPGVDEVFSCKSGPVNFAPDHSRLTEFSPHALHCGCVERHEEDLKELSHMLEWLEKKRAQSPTSSSPYSDHPNVSRSKHWGEKLKDLLFRRYGSGRKVTHQTVDSDEQVEQRYAQWFLDTGKNIWINPEGREVHTVRCDHLIDRIASTFGIHGIDPNWQHWNGGVFLFDSESHAFLDAWHQKTLSIFEHADWKIRDQGTLIATAWEFGLQQMPLLPIEYNFIVDSFMATKIKFSSEDKGVSNNGGASYITPFFVHVLNRFGDNSWKIWVWVDETVRRKVAFNKKLQTH